MKAMLLAAGLGTRFQPYTNYLAKPAIPFLNLPILAYPFYLLEQLGVSEVMINTHHLPQTIHQAVESLKPHLKAKIHYSHEEPLILSSGGGLNKVCEFFKGEENFLFVNADTLMCFSHDQGLLPLWQSHQQSSALATLMVCKHPGVGKEFGGVWVDGSRVLDIAKNPPNKTCQGLHYTGYTVLNQRVFDFIPQQEVSHIFSDVLLPAIDKGQKVLVHEEKALWFETGDPQNYNKASDEIFKDLQSINFGEKLNSKKTEGLANWLPIQTLLNTFDYFKVRPQKTLLETLLRR